MSIPNSLKKSFRDPEIARMVLASRIRRTRRSENTLDIPTATEDERTRVGSVLTAHGSDKADPHTYDGVYAGILQSLPTNPRILELGIGTNFGDVDCNMGLDGVPGASLRAFRELRPDATVFGADIDRRILFEEDRISTHWVDQLDPDSLRSLGRELGGSRSFDLVIDDGLHTKRSNLNTFRQLLSVLKPGGFYIIEDVDGSSLDFWRYVLSRHDVSGSVIRLAAYRGKGDINNMVVVAAGS